MKIFVCFLLCITGVLLGEFRAENLRKKLRRADEFAALFRRLESAVEYSGENLYSAVKREKDFVKIIDGLVENEDKFCANLLIKTLESAEKSNDIASAAANIKAAQKEIEEYKKTKQEEYRGKIKAMPALGLIAGLFVSVLII